MIEKHISLHAAVEGKSKFTFGQEVWYKKFTVFGRPPSTHKAVITGVNWPRGGGNTYNINYWFTDGDVEKSATGNQVQENTLTPR